MSFRSSFCPPVRRPFRRWLGVPLLTLGLLGSVLASPAHASESGDLIARTNGSRASAGLAGLQAHSELMGEAQSWANSMAAHRTVSHSNPSGYVRANWTKLGENVGNGNDVASVHSAFMASSPHRSNILDPAYQYIGVGVAHGSDGLIYVDEIFMRTAGGAPAPVPAPRSSAPRVSRSAVRAAPAPAPAPPPSPPPPPPPPPPPSPAERLVNSLTATAGFGPGLGGITVRGLGGHVLHGRW